LRPIATDGINPALIGDQFLGCRALGAEYPRNGEHGSCHCNSRYTEDADG